MGMKLSVHVYFHDNHQQTIASGTFLSSLLKLTNGSMHGDAHVYVIVFMTTTYKNEWRQVNKNPTDKKEVHIGMV